MTAEEAYDKHVKMWTAMREKYGDNPTPMQRELFKIRWCSARGENIHHFCYLCEYDHNTSGAHCGKNCIVDWGTTYDRYGSEYCGCTYGKVKYNTAPISEILALPKRIAPEGEE